MQNLRNFISAMAITFLMLGCVDALADEGPTLIDTAIQQIESAPLDVPPLSPDFPDSSSGEINVFDVGSLDSSGGEVLWEPLDQVDPSVEEFATETGEDVIIGDVSDAEEIQ